MRRYEDFQTGLVIQHPLGRTISAADNTWFTLLTVNTNRSTSTATILRRPSLGSRW